MNAIPTLSQIYSIKGKKGMNMSDNKNKILMKSIAIKIRRLYGLKWLLPLDCRCHMVSSK